VEVFVGDIEVAAKWYEDVPGLKETMRWEPEPVMIGARATKLALFRRYSAQAPSAGPLRISDGWRRVAWLTDKAGFMAEPKSDQRAVDTLVQQIHSTAALPG
jgi:catechol 2,3-dioxygenase-like lactoylglutathione lyase family enzyme